MKRLFTLIVCLFIMSGAFSQTTDDVIFKTLYEFGDSCELELPSWTHGSNKERNMAYYDGHLYITSVYNENKIYLVDTSSTSELVDSIMLPSDEVYGGAVELCGINITEAGNIYVANLVTDARADTFKVYQLAPVTNGEGYTISTVLKWRLDEGEVALRAGDDFAIYGDLISGSNGYIMTANTKDLRVYKWAITDGVLSQTAQLITLDGIFPAHETPIIHYGPVVVPVDENSFLLNSARMHPTQYDFSGTTLNTFNGTNQPGMHGISGLSHFNFKNRSFIVCGSTNYTTTDNPLPQNSFEVFEIMGSEFNFTGAVSLKGRLPERGFSTVKNSTYNYPIALDIQADKVKIFVMAPSAGFGAYELSIDGVGIDESKEMNSVSVYPNPAKDQINFNTTMRSVEIYSISGQLVRTAFNTKQVNIEDLNGLYIVCAQDNQGQVLREKIIINW